MVCGIGREAREAREAGGAVFSRSHRRASYLRLSSLALGGVLLAACSGSEVTHLPPGPGDAKRGEKIAALAGGCGCHSADTGAPLSGDRGLPTPFGTFYSSNLTPDPETGLGGWSDEEIDTALRRGRLRDGTTEAPVMPWYAYAGMADEDARDLIAWLRTLEPVRRQRRPDEIWVPLPRLAFRAWVILFSRFTTPPQRAPSEPLARGRYLVDHVAICGDCHTPRTVFGSPARALAFAGNAQGPFDELIPNITPDKVTGIGNWSTDDMVSVLEMGMLPNMDSVSGLMAEVVDGVHGAPGYAQAPLEDLRAMAEYLRTVPPVANAVRDGD